MPSNLAECPGEDCALSYPTMPTTYQPNFMPTILSGLGCGGNCGCKSCGGVPNPYPVALSGIDGVSIFVGWGPIAGAVIGSLTGLIGKKSDRKKRIIRNGVIGAVLGLMIGGSGVRS